LLFFWGGGQHFSLLLDAGAQSDQKTSFSQLEHNSFSPLPTNPLHTRSYEIGKASFMSNPNPRKLWPYIVHGPNLIPDSSDAAEYLAATYPEAAGKLLRPADPKAAALVHVVTRMLDEALFPALLYFRMAAPANQPHTEEAYFGSLPWLARKMVARSVFARTANRLYMQGVGKRTGAFEQGKGVLGWGRCERAYTRARNTRTPSPPTPHKTNRSRDLGAAQGRFRRRLGAARDAGLSFRQGAVRGRRILVRHARRGAARRRA
jgi:hypothetical protein